MTALHQFVKVKFHRFKAFRAFSLKLKHFNILVGPNNAGKSTILAAFRILAEGLRKAYARKPEFVRGPNGNVQGYVIDLQGVAVAEENLFFDYDDSEPAYVQFTLSNMADILLYFPEPNVCYMIADGQAGPPRSPAKFKEEFDCPVGFVPILGPVEHREPLYQKEAARLALYSYSAARNFRNIWHHYSDKFPEFRQMLQATWPGMDIEPPKPDYSHDRPLLHMFCPEDRIPREIFWSGFGFQVWCQMLTHLVQSSESSIFLIDEPDIYLHSDLQRQLLGLLRNLGPDILIATHSTEMITEAEPDDIVVVDKRQQSARRIRRPDQLVDVFELLGSNLNPVLTQLAKTRRVVFVEGKDFQVISKFARILGESRVANRADFAVVPVEGSSPDRIRSLQKGMEKTLGAAVGCAVILDRDYRTEEEARLLADDCGTFAKLVLVLDCKEVENFLLVPTALDRAAERRVQDRSKRGNVKQQYAGSAEVYLREFAAHVKDAVAARYLAARRGFDRKQHSSCDETTSNERALKELGERWKSEEEQWQMVPGKEALAHVNRKLQEGYGVSVTPTAVIDAMKRAEVPEGVVKLVAALVSFSQAKIGRDRD